MLDLLTIVIILIFVFFGFKKGVARAALTSASTLIAGIVSSALSKPIAESIYESSIKPSLVSKIDNAVKTAQQSGKSVPTSDIIKSLPNYVRNSLPSFDITNERLRDAIRDGSKAAEGLLRPIIVSFITCIVTVILFLLIVVAAKIIIKIVCDKMDMVTKGIVDSFFGALVGLLEGFLVVIVIAFVLRIAIPHMNEVPELFSDESISDSYVFRGIYDSPILREIISNTTDSPNVDEV